MCCLLLCCGSELETDPVSFSECDANTLLPTKNKRDFLKKQTGPTYLELKCEITSTSGPGVSDLCVKALANRCRKDWPSERGNACRACIFCRRGRWRAEQSRWRALLPPWVPTPAVSRPDVPPVVVHSPGETHPSTPGSAPIPPALNPQRCAPAAPQLSTSACWRRCSALPAQRWESSSVSVGERKEAGR